MVKSREYQNSSRENWTRRLRSFYRNADEVQDAFLNTARGGLELQARRVRLPITGSRWLLPHRSDQLSSLCHHQLHGSRTFLTEIQKHAALRKDFGRFVPSRPTPLMSLPTALPCTMLERPNRCADNLDPMLRQNMIATDKTIPHILNNFSRYTCFWLANWSDLLPSLKLAMLLGF